MTCGLKLTSLQSQKHLSDATAAVTQSYQCLYYIVPLNNNHFKVLNILNLLFVFSVSYTSSLSFPLCRLLHDFFLSGWIKLVLTCLQHAVVSNEQAGCVTWLQPFTCDTKKFAHSSSPLQGLSANFIHPHFCSGCADPPLFIVGVKLYLFQLLHDFPLSYSLSLCLPLSLPLSRWTWRKEDVLYLDDVCNHSAAEGE